LGDRPLDDRCDDLVKALQKTKALVSVRQKTSMATEFGQVGLALGKSEKDLVVPQIPSHNTLYYIIIVFIV